MRFLLGALTIGIFGLALRAEAAPSSSSPAASVDRGCRQDPQDPFDLGWRNSPNSQDQSRQCVHTEAVRAVQKLEADPQHVRFANFYHNHRYWIATWNRDDLPHATLIVLHFASGVPLVMAAHTQVRFQFPQGLELIDQKGTGERAIVKDMIFSWEAAFSTASTYKFLYTLRRNFPIVGRALSTETTLAENSSAPGRTRLMDEYPLDLSDRAVALLLQTNIESSSQRGFRVFYRILSENCTSRLFDVIDDVLRTIQAPFVEAIPRFRTSASTDPIIGPTIEALRKRHLIPGSLVPPTLNREFGWGIDPN